MSILNVLVSYDVNTETKEGRRRLRQVAKICKDYGQRVQFSVFECRVNLAQYEIFRSKLTKTINPQLDSLRIYRLIGNREDCVESFGRDRYIDFDEPLII
jgi:CRISPR-associated protein Cas2